MSTTLNVELERLQYQLDLLRKSAAEIQEFFINMASSPAEALENLSSTLSYQNNYLSTIDKVLFSLENTLRNQKHTMSIDNKAQIWNFLLDNLLETIKTNADLAEQAISIASQSPYAMCAENLNGFLHAYKQKLHYLIQHIGYMDFDEKTILHSHQQKIDARRRSLEVALEKENTDKPGVMKAVAANIAMACLMKTQQTPEQRAAKLRGLFLKGGSNVVSRLLQIDKKTVSRIIEYHNPQRSSKWYIPISGSGADYTDLLDIAQKVAIESGANVLGVDYLPDKITSFSTSVKILINAVNYLIAAKEVRLEDIIFIGHSNGGRIALETSAILNQSANNAGKGCKVILNNSYSTLEDAIVQNIFAPLNFKPTTSAGQDSMLAKKTREFFKDALEKTGYGYNAEEAINAVGHANVISIYTGPLTSYSDKGQKQPKVTDAILGANNVEGKQHVKKTKVSTPTIYQKAQYSVTYASNSAQGYKQKLHYIGPQANQHDVIKGVTGGDIKHVHNVILPELLEMAAGKLTRRQADNEDNSPRACSTKLHIVSAQEKKFKQWMKNLGMVNQHEDIPPTGIRLSLRDKLYLQRNFIALGQNKSQTWPTQEQLMRLFQASGEAADLIIRYEGALTRLICGDNSLVQQRHGLMFIKAALGHLRHREQLPDAKLDGVGAFMSFKQIETVQNILQNIVANSAVAHHNSLPCSFFANSSNKKQAAVAARQRQRCTVSDLDPEKYLMQKVRVC